MKTASCESAGWLVKQTDDRVVLALSLDPGSKDRRPTASGFIVIPRPAIRKMVCMDRRHDIPEELKEDE